jgi:hypothetical protein
MEHPTFTYTSTKGTSKTNKSLNMKNLKLFVGGGGIDDGSQNLIQRSLESINDQNHNKEIQNLVMDHEEKFLVANLYQKI